MYNAALYLRLSREDDAHEGSSQSIINQQNFLLNYAAQNGYGVQGVYSDDGFSGTGYDRPEFLHMLKAIEAGMVNMVITKDLSRLGRDYIMTGYYVERYFPEKGVRYIAVNDGVDTSAEDDLLPFRAVVNDMYAKDISKKVRTALMTRKRGGYFIGSNPPYGYLKDPSNKGKLIPDPKTALNAFRIFELYVEFKSVIATARALTTLGIPTPSGGVNAWSDVMVRRILTSETYIGNLVQNRTRKVSYKVNKRKVLDRSNHIIIPRTHEGIVPCELFALAQETLRGGFRGGGAKRAKCNLGIVASGQGCAGDRRKNHKGDNFEHD